MIVISHDRRFLNSVCTHMADLDYGEIRLYSGNYDDFMIASTQARERLISDNAKKQAKIDELVAGEALRRLRLERDRLLLECDWVVIKATELGKTVSEKWVGYRQTLRHLPENASPKLNSERPICSGRYRHPGNAS